MISAAQAMVHCLENEGVSIVFGYPGAAICPFYDLLDSSGIRHILVRQEQNAGHAASGYARISGKVGVCVVTSGPGATNLITALATAYMDSVPMVAITGQVSSDLLGRDVFQEADITGAAEPFTKHSYLVKNAQDIGTIFKEAFFIASTGRPGPVLIDIPIDIQMTQIDFVYPQTIDIRGYKPTTKGHAVQIRRVLQALSETKKPVICAGGGVITANAQAELVALAEKCQIPVVTTMMGLGVMPSDHPLNFGMLGMHGTRSANTAVHEADLLMIIGARVGDRAMSAPGVIAKRTKIVHIDIDPAEIGKNMGTHIPLVGDCKIVLGQLLDKCPSVKAGEMLHKLSRIRLESRSELEPNARYVNPKLFLERLSDRCQQDAVAVVDVGQNQIWAANHFKIKRGKFLTSGGMGTMGYSLGAAIGAKLAAPDRQIITICGDGSFQMMMCELATMCQSGVVLKIVLFRNNRLGMVRELQKNRYHNHQTAVFLDGSPDFIALCNAYQIPCERVCCDSEAEAAIDRLLSAQTPYLLECVVDSEESSMDERRETK